MELENAFTFGGKNNSKDVELRKLQDDLHRANKQHKDCEDEINNLKIKANDLAERNKFYLHGKIRMTAVYFGLDRLRNIVHLLFG